MSDPKPKRVIEESDWRGLYRENWKGVITDESFAHPAKYGRGLIRKIYQHAVEEGWLHAGAEVLDCFGGVALGALECQLLGCAWTGVELEARFVSLGNGNLDLWNSRYGHLLNWGTARLIQGDSRQLSAVIRGADVSVSSPPYADSVNSQDHGIDWSKTGPATGNRKRGGRN